MGEEICVFIRLADGQDCTVEEIRDYCREKVRQRRITSLPVTHAHQLPLRSFQMASFKIPRYVLFVNSFPISSSGKVSSLNSDSLSSVSPFFSGCYCGF